METTKICNICNKSKQITEFYKSAAKCKPCNKQYVKQYRIDNIDKVREYDRNRPNHKERIEKDKARKANLPQHKKDAYKKVKQKIMDTPEYKTKRTANTYMRNAVRDGILQKLDYCEHCEAKGVPLDGHHPSYLNPLDVVWLCKPCHGKEHKRLNEIKRNKDKQ